ncbi:F0F1 ATP synthase subunit epsilon [Methylomonas methanica]|uniref:ATP synthase epsilon chain n=1 Tax=Methylomonas methanica (strain DSM 25384 / MC09) TaxID=857087 RepID=G0A6H5_METMM|nr:F0F1 ATP synthase subunit epsilon [Methylomonas methanica]AEF99276.1 ATP synthase F1, epsilon subunit [Methylomonas methanica MC09]
MNTFELRLLDSQNSQTFSRVSRFIGADEEGSFAVLAGHAPLIVLLRLGLARFCDADEQWHYLALPGGVCRFAGNCLSICTVRYFVGDKRDEICQQLSDELARTDSQVHAARLTLSQIEKSLVRRLAELSLHGGV